MARPNLRPTLRTWLGCLASSKTWQQLVHLRFPGGFNRWPRPSQRLIRWETSLFYIYECFRWGRTRAKSALCAVNDSAVASLEVASPLLRAALRGNYLLFNLPAILVGYCPESISDPSSLRILPPRKQ